MPQAVCRKITKKEKRKSKKKENKRKKENNKTGEKWREAEVHKKKLTKNKAERGQRLRDVGGKEIDRCFLHVFSHVEDCVFFFSFFSFSGLVFVEKMGGEENRLYIRSI